MNIPPEELFRRWFVAPIEVLQRELPKGDGAFVALMAILPLYERAIIAELKLARQDISQETIGTRVESDLGINEDTRRRFWAIYRNGFMHQGMGLDGKSKWRISASYKLAPEIKTENGGDFVCLNPWDFARHTIEKFVNRPELITASDSFPFASIWSAT